MTIELWSNPNYNRAPAVLVNREMNDTLCLHTGRLASGAFVELARKFAAKGLEGEFIGNPTEIVLKDYAMLVATWSPEEGLSVLAPASDPALDRYVGAEGICEAYKGSEFDYLVRRAAIYSEEFAAELLLAATDEQLSKLGKGDLMFYLTHSNPALRQAAIRIAPRLSLAS